MNQDESHRDGGNSSHQLNNESVAIFSHSKDAILHVALNNVHR